MSSKILRQKIIDVLFSPSNQDNIIIEDLSSKKSFTVRQFRSLLVAFIATVFTKNHQNDNNSWNVVALEISDIFPLALAEISCVLLNFPFLPLDPSDSSSYRSRQHELCKVTKIIKQDELPSLESLLTMNYDEELKTVNDFIAFLETRSNPTSQKNSSSLPLYLIFTSGSTTTNSSMNNNNSSSSILPLPKCLVVDDENLWTYLRAISTALEIHDESSSCSSRIFCLSSPTFDPSIGDIFSLFFHHHDDGENSYRRQQPTLLCATKSQILNNVTKCLNEAKRITHIITSPALWKNVDLNEFINFPSLIGLDDEGPSASQKRKGLKVCLGGEAIPRSMLEKWKLFILDSEKGMKNKTSLSSFQLFSIYGLTEASVYQCLRSFEEELYQQQQQPEQKIEIKTNLIGPCLDQNEMKLFLSVLSNNDDENENENTNNVQEEEGQYLTGELVILSKQVVRGAIINNTSSDNDDEKNKNATAIVEPFDSENPHLLRTGDLVRVPVTNLNLQTPFLHHGKHPKFPTSDEKMFEIIIASRSHNSTKFCFIEMLGRIDFQVKISGRRVSLEDIEGTVESCLCSSLVEKCIAIVNKQGTGVTGVVSMRKNSIDDQHPTASLSLLEKVFRFVVNLSLRNREQLNEVVITSASFPLTKNGKIDRKKLKENVLLLQENNYSANNNHDDDDDARANDQKTHQHQHQQHPMRTELEHLVKEIWSESLGVDQKLLGNLSNFFVLGGDSLLCVKVSRETLYAIFPEEADDRTATTPKRRQRKGDFAEFLRSLRKKENGLIWNDHHRHQHQRDHEKDENENTTATSSSLLNLRVDEFGAFRGPVQPRVLLQHSTLKEYCDSLWKEICNFVGFHHNNNSDGEAKNSPIQDFFSNSSSSSSAVGGVDPNILYFSELLSESIELNNDIAVSLLLDYKKVLEPLKIDPVQQLGISPSNNSSSSNSAILKKSQKPRIAFPLHHAISKNHLQLVKLLVLRFGCKATDFNLSFHVTALHAASQLPDPAILEFLIDVGQGPLQVRDSRFQTLLHYCARSGVLETTRWLLKKCRKAPTNNDDERNENEKEAVVDQDDGNDDGNKNYSSNSKKKKNDHRKTPNSSSSDQRTNSIGLLNSMILARDRWQRTPLHWAIVNNHFDVAKCLIEEGEVEYFPAADRTKSQLLRLTHHRTALPYETPLELARRIQSENRIKKISVNNGNSQDDDDAVAFGVDDDEQMIELVSKSKLN